jgi:hypothetical protein
MASSVLDEIKTILVTVYPDTFNTPVYRCLGTNNGNGKRCNINQPSKTTQLNDATRLLESFVVRIDILYDESIYEKIEQFLRYSHCHFHRDKVMVNFKDWKQKKMLALLDDTTTTVSNPPSPFESSDLDPNAEDGRVSDRTLQTPNNMEANMNAKGVNEVSVSSAAAPPNQESELRPEMPIPSPGNPNYQIVESNAIAEQFTDIPSHLVDQGFEALGTLQRLNSIKEKKWPMLKAIENKFTKMDFKIGRVYIWTHVTDKRLIKIGFTEKDSMGRYKQSGNCYATTTEPRWETEQSFVGAYRVETIVRENLKERNIRLKSCANCTVAHKEWYQMDWSLAAKLIKEWAEFVTLAYKYEDGRLNELGRELVDELLVEASARLVKQLSAKRASAVVEELASIDDADEIDQLNPSIGGQAEHTPQDLTSLNRTSDGFEKERTSVSPSMEPAKAKPRWGARARRSLVKTFFAIIKPANQSRRSDSSDHEDKEKRDSMKERFQKPFQRFSASETMKAENLRDQTRLGTANEDPGLQMKESIPAEIPYRPHQEKSL